MNPVELAMHVANTKAFIEEDAVDVILERPGRVSNGAGGFRETPPFHLPSQRVRVITLTAGSVGGVERLTLSSNRLVVPDYVVLGIPELNVQRGDRLSLWGKTFEVVFVNDRPLYERKAEVAVIG